jgi:hypothetical protein
MGFYDLSKEERKQFVQALKEDIEKDLEQGNHTAIERYASDQDTYIRKTTYLIIGRYYWNHPLKRTRILDILETLIDHPYEKVRQTVVYSLGEIGKKHAEDVLTLLERGFHDPYHAVRNATIGALKQMSEKNPVPTLQFAKKLLHHQNPEIRRVIVHGIELRGRTHPEDILPLLAEVQHDKDAKVRSYVVHVVAQSSYKNGCLEKVIASLKTWGNKKLVEKALREILDVHKRYENFSEKTYQEAFDYINQQFEGRFQEHT